MDASVSVTRGRVVLVVVCLRAICLYFHCFVDAAVTNSEFWQLGYMEQLCNRLTTKFNIQQCSKCIHLNLITILVNY